MTFCYDSSVKLSQVSTHYKKGMKTTQIYLLFLHLWNNQLKLLVKRQAHCLPKTPCEDPLHLGIQKKKSETKNTFIL